MESWQLVMILQTAALCCWANKTSRVTGNAVLQSLSACNVSLEVHTNLFIESFITGGNLGNNIEFDFCIIRPQYKVVGAYLLSLWHIGSASDR